MNRKQYLREYYQKNKKHLSDLNKISMKKFMELNPWMGSFYKINQRCNNKKCKDYYRYGGRGIKNYLTKEEIKFLWFRDKAYEMKQATIDRINNDGHYELSNCRFIENLVNAIKDKILQKIGQYSLDGKLVKIWLGQNKISKIMNYSQPHLSRAIKEDRIAYGYKWRLLK